MKTRSIFSFLFSFTLIVYVAGCNSSTSELPFSQVHFSASSIKNLGGELLNAKVSAYTGENKNLAFTVESNSQREGILLQREITTLGTGIEFKNAEAEVVKLPGTFIINLVKEQKIYVLGVDKDRSEKVVKELGIPIENVSTYIGYGLAYAKNSNASSISSRSFQDQLLSINSTTTSCNSGGAGSTSCSTAGSCSVTCGSGYYSCCNYSCTCVRNPPQP